MSYLFFLQTIVTFIPAWSHEESTFLFMPYYAKSKAKKIFGPGIRKSLSEQSSSIPFDLNGQRIATERWWKCLHVSRTLQYCPRFLIRLQYGWDTVDTTINTVWENIQFEHSLQTSKMFSFVCLGFHVPLENC